MSESDYPTTAIDGFTHLTEEHDRPTAGYMNRLFHGIYNVMAYALGADPANPTPATYGYNGDMAALFERFGGQEIGRFKVSYPRAGTTSPTSIDFKNPTRFTDLSRLIVFVVPEISSRSVEIDDDREIRVLLRESDGAPVGFDFWRSEQDSTTLAEETFIYVAIEDKVG